MTEFVHRRDVHRRERPRAYRHCILYLLKRSVSMRLSALRLRMRAKEIIASDTWNDETLLSVVEYVIVIKTHPRGG